MHDGSNMASMVLISLLFMIGTTMYELFSQIKNVTFSKLLSEQEKKRCSILFSHFSFLSYFPDEEVTCRQPQKEA